MTDQHDNTPREVADLAIRLMEAGNALARRIIMESELGHKICRTVEAGEVPAMRAMLQHLEREWPDLCPTTDREAN